MLEETEAQQAHRIVIKGVAIILAVACIGTALLIHYGQRREYWASFDTINGSPSLEIRP